MEWTATFVGSAPVAGLVVHDDEVKPDLTNEAIATSREIRNKKAKKDHAQMTLSVTPEALKGDPHSSGESPLYQPIGKIICAHAHAEGTLKKTHLFIFIVSDEGCRVAGPNASYTCFTFKCKSDQDANAIAFATARTMASNASRREKVLKGPSDLHELEIAVKFWNSNSQPLNHLSMAKDGTVSGCLRLQCQVDQSLRMITKVVRLSNHVKGRELINLLSEKFNLTEADPTDYAVFEYRDNGDQTMLDDDGSPILIALTLRDPSEASFVLKKLPQGLMRVSKPSISSTSQPAGYSAESVGGAASTTGAESVRSGVSGITLAGLGGETSTDEELMSPLGPVLPYHPEDEELLLSVMISRQSGSGLGFKLTPAYLLQMCIAFCSLKHGTAALKKLLINIATEIKAVIERNPGQPEMFLFWACNTLKLMGALLRDHSVFAIFEDSAKPILDEALQMCLRGLDAAKEAQNLPPELADKHWSSLQELRAQITDQYRELDQNMSPDGLREVVNRITAAMPSPAKTDASQDYTQASPLKLNFPSGVDSNPMTSTPNNGSAPRWPTDDAERVQDQEREANGYPPLPEEWEELIDHDTKHRFFANHKTRQTSWTDPRDKLVTVNLVKGGKGLGIGISGAKRTRDGRLILGIFVSSLVPGSAADIDGTLKDGDEILEVNSHSLIGVSREGAIEFLKKVQHGETIRLLVAQEPRPGEQPVRQRHTQL